MAQNWKQPKCLSTDDVVFSRGMYTSEEEYGKYYAKKKMSDTKRHMLYEVISTGEKKTGSLGWGTYICPIDCKFC